MKRVTGLGGIFFKVDDPARCKAWYRTHLGLEATDETGTSFRWRDPDAPDRSCITVWSPFPRGTNYFGPGAAPFMINYRVADLDALLAQLRKEGVKVEDKVEEMEFGRFGWITDSEGNRVELWEPAAGY